jgi:calcineurin-like phosphoesterase family protein
MTTWFTADLHFGHVNIIRYTGRPYGDVPSMNAALIEHWNANVQPDDHVWVLGDLALGTIAESLPLVGRLNGHKRLLAGNHDRCWWGNGRKAVEWEQRYRDAGFNEIRQGVIPIDVGPHHVLACHFPYEGDSHDEDRFIAERPTDRGDWLIHGHVHDTWRQRGRMINVGVDAWAMNPVSEDELVALIDAGPADREVLPYGTTVRPSGRR